MHRAQRIGVSMCASLCTALALTACGGRTSLTAGSSTSSASYVGPASTSGGAPSSSWTGGTSTGDAQAASDSAGGTAPGCGGTCLGMSLPATPVTSVGQLIGTWAMCAGQLATVGPGHGGFPADTAGIRITPSGTAYLLVSDDAGGLRLGVGPQYVWHVALNTPYSGGNGQLLNFNDAYYGLLAYNATEFPSTNDCFAAMHLVCNTTGLPAYQSDFVLVGP
jgi:hypothetical protein